MLDNTVFGDTKQPTRTFLHRFWRVSFFQILNSASAFAVNVLMARWIGPRAFGDFFVFVSTMIVATIFFDFGLSRTVLRYSAFHQARGETVSKLQYYFATLKLKSVWGLGAWALCSLGAWLWGGELRMEYVLGLSAGLVLSFCQFFASVAQTEEDYTTYNWVLSFNTVRVGLVVGLWALGALTLPRVYALFILAPVLMLAGPAWRLLKDLRQAGTVPEEHFYSNLIRFGKWMLVLVILESVAQRLDVYMVRWLTDATVAGHYSGALTFFGIVVLLPTYTAFLSYPKFVEAVGLGDREALSRHYRFATDLNVVLAVPLALGLWAVGPDVVRIFLGPAFAESLPVFKYLAVFAILWSAQVNSGAIFFAHDRPQNVVVIVAGVLLTGLVAQWLLIPRLGLIGAGLALMITHGVGLLLYWGGIARAFALTPPWKHLVLYGVAGVLMAVVVRLMPSGSVLWLGIKSLTGALVYGGVVWGVQAWRGGEWVPWPKHKMRP